MIEQKEIEVIKEATEEFFKKMTISVADINIGLSSENKDNKEGQNMPEDKVDVVSLDIQLNEPQILIGQGGQTLFEIQRVLRMILNKKLQKIFYFNLDINDYKKKKIEYLKDLARELANQVAINKETKVLSPMSAYERRIVHAELSLRQDIITESQGEGLSRHIVIIPK